MFFDHIDTRRTFSPANLTNGLERIPMELNTIFDPLFLDLLGNRH